MKTEIKFIPVGKGVDLPRYHVCKDGVQVGAIWGKGMVTDNQCAVVSCITIQGLARLLGVTDTVAAQIFQGELARLHPDGGGWLS